MAFGVGALISSVSFELVSEAFDTASGLMIVGLGVATGALVYFFGDMLIDKYGGKWRKSSTKNKNSSGLAILLGTILDGIPESLVIGLSLASGQAVSMAMVAAVFLSNIPEAISASVGLKKSGWKKATIYGLWAVIVLVSAAASWAGFAIFGDSSPLMRAFILAFAGGAILTMLADSMMPEAYRDSGNVTGLIVVLGFCIAFGVTTIE
jgi:ZIP family zinc transporter